MLLVLVLGNNLIKIILSNNNGCHNFPIIPLSKYEKMGSNPRV